MSEKIVTVDAKLNSINGGTGCQTGITVTQGQRLRVITSPATQWKLSVGTKPTISCNANGFVWSQNGATFPFGTLVGTIDGVNFFHVGTNYDKPAPASGTLMLYCWDSNNADNAGTLSVRIISPNNNQITNVKTGTTYPSIAAAISGAGPGDTISIPAGTFNEDLHIIQAVTLIGAGSGKTSIKGSGTQSVITVQCNSGTTKLRDITITGGNQGNQYMGGGGILVYSGNLTVSSSVISGNTTSGTGGGIYADGGDFTLESSTVNNNSAGVSGGGVSVTSGNATISNSKITANSAEYYGGGICHNTASGSLVITGSRVENNSCSGQGTAVLNNGGTSCTATNSAFQGTCVGVTNNGGNSGL